MVVRTVVFGIESMGVLEVGLVYLGCWICRLDP